MYASWGLFNLRNKSCLNDLNGEDNASKCRYASIPPYKDWIYRFAKTCAIFALLTYKLMLTHYFTNNLPDLPYRSHTVDNNVSYYGCPLVVWPEFLNQGIDKVLYIIWMMRPLSNTSRNNAPGMFCWIDIWRPGWPVHHTDNIVVKEGRGLLRCVGTSIILH